MFNLYRNVSVFIAWLISVSVIAVAAHMGIGLSAFPIVWAINLFAGLPFQIPEPTSPYVTLFQIVMVLVILRTPGLFEFIVDFQQGARSPSEKELNQINAAHEYLRRIAKKKNMRLPRIVWRVIDTKEYNAITYGRNRIAITQGALYDTKFREGGLEELAGLIAHEIGHIRHLDNLLNSITVAVFWPFLIPLTLNNLFYRVPYVGLGFNLIVLPWNLVISVASRITNLTSRMTEFRADEYSQKLLGRKCMNRVFDNLPEETSRFNIFTYWLRTHPPTPLRVKNLYRQSDYKFLFNEAPGPKLVARFQSTHV